MDNKDRQLLMEGGYQPIGASLKCPNCDKDATVFLSSILSWFCLSCGIEFTLEDATPCYIIQEYDNDPRPDMELLEEE